MRIPLKYTGDALSLLRALAVLPVIVCSITGHWTAAFVALGIGWATDLVDGAIAKKWGGLRDSHPDFDVDGICDTVLAFGSTFVPVVYAYIHYDMTAVIGLTVLYALTMLVGGRMASVMNEPGHRWLIAGNMIVLHAIVQIGGGLVWFAYMSAGALAAWLTIALLTMIAFFQKRKIGLWWQGRFK